MNFLTATKVRPGQGRYCVGMGTDQHRRVRIAIGPAFNWHSPEPGSMRAFLLSTSLLLGTLLPASHEALLLLLEAGAVDMEARGLGGHQGECLQVTVANRTARPITTSIPVGWVFPSSEAPVQDLIVVREEMVALTPGGSRLVTCRAFCCEAPNHSPDPGATYRTGAPGTDELQRVAHAIAAGRYPDHLAQHAIWVVSDGHDLAGMGALDGTVDDTLRHALARITGLPPPTYTVRFADDPHRACSGRPEAIQRDLRVDLPSGGLVTLVVVDREGRIVRTLLAREVFAPGDHRIPVELDVLDWPPGRYALHLHTSADPGVHRMPFAL